MVEHCCKDVALDGGFECFCPVIGENRGATAFGAGRLRATRYHKNCDNVAGSTRRGVSSPFPRFRGLAVQTTRGRKPSFFVLVPDTRQSVHASHSHGSPAGLIVQRLLVSIDGALMRRAGPFQELVSAWRLAKGLDPSVSAQICALTPRFFYRKIKETEGRRKTAGE